VLAKAYWEDWKGFHLHQILSYYRDMHSFPVIGNSTYALLWKRKFVKNPHVTNLLKDIKEEHYAQVKLL
jgi:hypothetical protein